MKASSLLLFAFAIHSSLVFAQIEPETRAPLPACDSIGPDGLEVHCDLPPNQVPLPGEPDIRWWRGNAWSVTIPGLPFVPGGSSIHPERALTWFLDRWSPDWQQTILDFHRRRGYTHFVLSWPDSRDGNGQSVGQFVDMARRVHNAGFYVVVFLGSKVYDPHDATAAEWAPRVDPVLNSLIANGVIDIAVVGWELDLWNIPGAPLQTIIDHITSITVPAGVPTYVHFSTGKISWQADGESTLDWWGRHQRGKLHGVLYQTDPNWTAGMMQARLNDVQVRFGPLGDSGFGHPFDAVAWEVMASLQFDGPCDEANCGDLKGYEAICTPGPVPIMGFGNGARLPDGRSTASHNLPPRPSATRYTIFMQCSDQHYVVAEGGGGGDINCNRDVPSVWETLYLFDPSSDPLSSGHAVYVQAADQSHYFTAFGGGGAGLTATAPRPLSWETFYIEKDGGGPIYNGDTVCMRTVDGAHFWRAEFGGGDGMSATSAACNAWEKFTITIQ